MIHGRYTFFTLSALLGAVALSPNTVGHGLARLDGLWPFAVSWLAGMPIVAISWYRARSAGNDRR